MKLKRNDREGEKKLQYKANDLFFVFSRNDITKKFSVLFRFSILIYFFTIKHV